MAAAAAAAAAAMVVAAVAAAMEVGGYVERARGEEIGVTRMQVRVPRIHIGDNLAHIKAMRLANVQTFGSNVWRPNINLSAPQIDFSFGADRKMVILYVYLCNITKKSRFWRRYADKKTIKMVILRVPSSAKENKFNTVLCVSA